MVSAVSQPGAGRTRIISVSASSKKAGKSTLASHLVRELEADYGLKVSSGGRHAGSEAVITDPKTISRPGTDTGALVDAGARTVLWVSADRSSLAAELERALAMLPPGGLLVMEGNSALESVKPDLAVFLMGVPFDDFKDSAAAALEKADLVLVDLTGRLRGKDRDSLERELAKRNGGAKILFYEDEEERLSAWAEAVRLGSDL